VAAIGEKWRGGLTGWAAARVREREATVSVGVAVTGCWVGSCRPDLI
jgi:hypothetical protein